MIRIALPLFLFIFLLFTGFSSSAQAVSSSSSAPDPVVLVRRALVENKRSLERLRNYIFVSDLTEESFGKNNRVEKVKTVRHETFFIDGEPAVRTLLENGQPPSEKDRLKEEKAFDEKLSDAHAANPKHKEERQKKAAKNLAEEIALREDVADGFLFTVLGEETRNGRRCIRIGAEPKPGFKGKSKLKALFPFLHGTLLIDAESGEWIEINASMLRKLGGGPIYLGNESYIHLHQEQVAPDLWVLNKLDVRLNVRLLLLHKNVHLTGSAENFRRFGSSVRILDVQETTSEEEKAQKPVKQ